MADDILVSLTPDIAGKLERLFNDSSLSYADMIRRIVEDATADSEDFDEQERQEIALAIADVKSGKYYTSKDVEDMISAKRK